MTIFDSIRNLNWRQVNILDVMQGCMNHFLIDLQSEEKKELVTKVSVYRMKLCAGCHMNSNNWCNNSGDVQIMHTETGQMVNGCGCQLHCKTALLSEQCPAAIWKSV